MNASHEKFIHHNAFCARNASDDGHAGCYDVIEDETGPYVFGRSEGMILGRFDTLADATAKAEACADAYDEAFSPLNAPVARICADLRTLIDENNETENRTIHASPENRHAVTRGNALRAALRALDGFEDV